MRYRLEGYVFCMLVVVSALDADAGRIDLPGTWGGGNEATIEAWVNTDKVINNVQAIVSSRLISFVHFQLSEVSASTVVYPGGPTFNAPPESPTGVWRHIVMVAESGNSRLFIDGVPVQTDPNPVSSISSSNTVYIGSGFLGDRPFLGLIDEVAIYDTALSDARIQDHFNAATALDDSYSIEVLADNPVGYWPLNDTLGSAVDQSGNARHGTPLGGIVYQQSGALSNGDFAMRFFPEPTTYTLALTALCLVLRRRS